MDISSRSRSPLISLIAPVFNEEDSLGLFMEQVNVLVRASSARFEMVIVNDGSSDNTLTVLKSLSVSCPIRIVDLSRNFGKEAAMTAGLAMAKGDAGIPIDVDLQDPIEIIEQFITEWQNGYDMVYGVRESRHTDTHMKVSDHPGAFYHSTDDVDTVISPINIIGDIHGLSPPLFRQTMAAAH